MPNNNQDLKAEINRLALALREQQAKTKAAETALASFTKAASTALDRQEVRNAEQ